jgi:hypothetical protein
VVVEYTMGVTFAYAYSQAPNVSVDHYLSLGLPEMDVLHTKHTTSNNCLYENVKLGVSKRC